MAYAIGYAGAHREAAEAMRQAVEQAVAEGTFLDGAVELRKGKNGYRLSELSFEYEWGRRRKMRSLADNDGVEAGE